MPITKEQIIEAIGKLLAQQKPKGRANKAGKLKSTMPILKGFPPSNTISSRITIGSLDLYHSDDEVQYDEIVDPITGIKHYRPRRKGMNIACEILEEGNT